MHFRSLCKIDAQSSDLRLLPADLNAQCRFSCCLTALVSVHQPQIHGWPSQLHRAWDP